MQRTTGVRGTGYGIRTCCDANGKRTNPGYVVGADNRLLSDGTYTYWYGAEGNRTARFIDANHDGVLDAGDTGVTEYMWDARGRLVRVTDYATCGGSPTQIVDYLYDAENRWIGEAVDSNGDGTVDHQIRFAYDGNQIVLEFEKDGAGDLTAANLSHRYLWDPSVVDHVLADEQLLPLPPQEGQGACFDLSTPGNIVWPLADRLGTVRDLAVYNAQTGVTSVVNHRVYDSFGNLKSQTNAAVDCLFAFTGRAFDKSAGLQYNTNRWYDPGTGRWMSKDPIGFNGRDSNLYRYCGNGPINAVDPTGEGWWPWQWKIWPWNWSRETRDDAADGVVTTIGTQAPAGMSELAGGAAAVGEMFQADNFENVCKRNMQFNEFGDPKEYAKWKERYEKVKKWREDAKKGR